MVSYRSNLKILLLIFLAGLCFFIVEGLSENCIDSDPRCPRWNKQGKCEKSSSIRKDCPKSCQTCSGSYDAFLYKHIEHSTQNTVIFLSLFLLFIIIGIFVAWIKLQSSGGICRSKGTMKGKVVVITGATSGIGLDSAFHLALRGAHVIIGSRSLKRGFKVAKNLRQQTGQKFIEVKKLDLSSLDSVREFAQEINEEVERIDVLINNAAIISGNKRTLTTDNNEITFQVNYLGHFLLTKLLIGKLKESKPSRIINVVCDGYEDATIDFSNLQGKKGFSNLAAYNSSKLALMLFTQELSKVIKRSGVTVNAVNPGKSITNLRKNVFPYNQRLAWLFITPYVYLFWKTGSLGAETAYYCSLEKELEEVSGKYFKDCELAISTSLDDEIARKLWEVSERLIQPHKPLSLNGNSVSDAESIPTQDKHDHDD